MSSSHLQLLKHSPEVEMSTTRRVALVEGDREAAEMLHMFFRLMELECSLVRPDPDAVPTVRRLHPDILIVDLDLPDLRALDIAREVRLAFPAIRIIFLSEDEPIVPVRDPVVRQPHGRFEELLHLFEVMLAVQG
jgi:DNA-binding NtrC family response regulator